jgi:hypothetical protein
MAMQSNPEKVSIGDRRIGRLRRLIISMKYPCSYVRNCRVRRSILLV